MSRKSAPPPSAAVEPEEPFDPDATRPVPLQLIARLAAQDPAVQLKIGVIEWSSDLTSKGEEKEAPKK